MNISLNNRTVRTIAAATALGLAFAGGIATGRVADATPRESAAAPAVERAAPPEATYRIVDSRQVAIDAERADVVTAQERVLVATQGW